MLENRGSGTILVSAIIVGVAIIAGSIFVATALNRVTVQVNKATAGLQEIKTALADAKTSLQQAAKAQPAPKPARRRGPDPNKVNTAGAPLLGPKTAKVKIIEFSDFQ